MRAKRTLLRGDFCGLAKLVRYSLGSTARKTSRCNLAIEISFVPSSQSTFNFSVLRGTRVDLLRPGPGKTRLAGEPDFF